MNPIQKAIQDVTFAIPKEILRQAFIDNEYHVFNYPVSVETMIRSKVLDQRVLPDCNLVGGAQVEISLRNLDPKFDDGLRQVFVIPKTASHGRSITSVLSLSYNDHRVTTNRRNASSVIRESLNVLDSHDGYKINSTANVSLVGENTIMVESETRLSTDAILRCVVSNDEEMQNLNPKTVPVFSKMALLATKAYIYNTLAVRMDIGQLHGGMTLGRFREIVDEYADAEELYTEYRDTKWKKVAFMDDKESYRRMLRLTANGSA